MSRMKKIGICAFVLIVLLIIVMGIYNISNSGYKYGLLKTVKVGAGRSLDWSREHKNEYDVDYSTNKNVICIEPGQGLSYDKVTSYRVISQISINGTISTDYKNDTVDNKENAKFAYILYANSEKDYPKFPNVARELELGQQAVYASEYNWMKNVGQNHSAKRYKDGKWYDGKLFTNDYIGGSKTKIGETDPKGEVANLVQEAENYANNIEIQKQFNDDKMDKNNIKVANYKKDGKDYLLIGDFIWTFSGTLTKIEINGKDISNLIYIKYNGTTPKEVSIGEIKSDEKFCIGIPKEANINSIKKIKGYRNIDSYSVDITFLEAAGEYQHLIIADPKRTQDSMPMEFNYDIKLFGNLKVIKVNKDNEIVKLPNVGFYIKNEDTGKYIAENENGISYVDSINDAKEFMTDENGEISIKDLIVGTYKAYETKNPNYGYEIIKEGQPVDVTVDKTAELKIPNKQKYVKLSGYVWLDKISQKQSVRNDLYNDGDYDQNDILLDGITVKLKNRVTGETVKDENGQYMEATTSNGGAYKFIDVLVDELDKYYIEFEYDGLTYTNVIPHTDKDNGSKSAENATKRTEFNNNFAVVEGKSTNTSITRDTAGNEKHTITYNVNNHEALIDKTTSYYGITADTDQTGYKIRDHFTYGQEEIKYINLGLYEREMPDIALMKDLHDVKMTLNGKTHVYEYAQRYINAGEYGDGFNVGVKFGEKYGSMSYSRAVYKEDATYETEDNSRELKVYVTYQIKMKNQSTELKTKINSIIDYYDARYNLVKIGTGVNEGNITGEIAIPQSSSYNDKYNKAVIDVNTEIGAQGEKDIFVQFELSREAVLNILNDKANLDNVTEINSYSVYDKNGKVYAGIDKDSNPGNAVPGDKSTYEDDTDSAPGLKLEVALSREISGRVFLDETSNTLMTGEVRQGSGKYEEGEKGIEGVLVTFTENSGTGKKYEATTNANEMSVIKEFIPGDYTLTYTWGDNTYTVQNYKSTIWTIENRTEKQENGANWYKVNMDTQYSDAMDDYELRKRIDNGEKITKMNSITPEMNVEIEITTTITTSFDDKFIVDGYNVRNIDFGIVERARQDIALGKRVKKFKVSLANDQIIADVTVNEDGSISGQTNHVTYMGPSSKTLPNNGFVKLEMDSELIQGAKVEATYEIKVTNNSEIEYLSENFYKYGIKEGEIAQISPVAVVDYLDSFWGFDTTKNSEWNVKTVDELKDKLNSSVYEDKYSTIANKTILYTEAFNKKLKPTDSITKEIYFSKELANSDEITLDNEAEIIGDQESDNDSAETIIITTNTGDNLNFVIPVMVGTAALIILGVGIILIKKKTL